MQKITMCIHKLAALKLRLKIFVWKQRLNLKKKKNNETISFPKCDVKRKLVSLYMKTGKYVLSAHQK